jgi:ABC-type phosphate transport system substrate-binding protein
VTRRTRRSLANVLVVVLVVSTVVAATIGATTKRSSADVSTDTLLGEGGSLAEPIVNKLLVDAARATAPISLTYFNANVDQGRDDFAARSADFDVTELPLTSTGAATAATNHRTFAYVPFAASPIAIGAIVECERDNTLLPTTMCPNLQVSVLQLAQLFTQTIGSWDSPQLSTISDGKPITPFAQGANVLPELLADPAASTQALIALFDADSAAAAVWSAYITSLKGTNDSPTETWPTSGGVHGGDAELAQSLVPFNTSTLQPLSDPSTWGLGQIAPLAADWIGPPENIPTIAIQNNAGAYVLPTVAAATAALRDATFDSTTNLVTYQNSKTDAAAYPLMVMSYMVVPTAGLSASKATALAALIRFMLGSQGQADITGLGAAPVTPTMVNAGLAVANEVADSAASYSITVNSSSSATIAPGATATLAEKGLPSSATGTVSFTSGTTSLCTITLPSTTCNTASALAAGSYGKISASYVYGSGTPAIAATNTVSLTVSSPTTTTPTTTTTTTPTTTTTITPNGATGPSDSSGTSGGTLAFTGASDLIPLTALGSALVVSAAWGRRRLKRRMVE